MATIHDDLDREFAPAWKPQPGDKLVGIVTDLSSRDGEYGAYPIVTVRTEDGEFAVHAFHEVLANELSRVAPKVGDDIGVKYVGKDPDKGYHRYRVRRSGDASTFDWQRFGDATDASPDTPAASDVPADTDGLAEAREAVAAAKTGGGSADARNDDDIPF